MKTTQKIKGRTRKWKENHRVRWKGDKQDALKNEAKQARKWPKGWKKQTRGNENDPEDRREGQGNEKNYKERWKGDKQDGLKKRSKQTRKWLKKGEKWTQTNGNENDTRAKEGTRKWKRELQRTLKRRRAEWNKKKNMKQNKQGNGKMRKKYHYLKKIFRFFLYLVLVNSNGNHDVHETSSKTRHPINKKKV